MTKIKEIKKVKKLVKTQPERKLTDLKKTRIKVIGIGGGGCTIVSELASRIKKASFVAANTDKQALKTLNRNVSIFQFGESVTKGLGTGMNYELAKNAALAEKERIKKIFNGYDLCILIATLGGGVGSGSTPIFAKEAKNSGTLTIGLFTLPFNFEGAKKQELAKESLQRIRPYLNAVSILPNDRIFQVIEKNTPLKEALSFMNKNLADSLEGLIETIYLPGIINIDFADLKAILRGQGKIAYLNTVEFGGDNRVQEATKAVLNSPLYPYNIKGAKKVLFNIVGDKNLLLSEVSGISKMIFEQISSQAQIIFGVSQSQNIKDKIKTFVLATGCTVKGVLNDVPKEELVKEDEVLKTQNLKPQKQPESKESKKQKRKLKSKAKLQQKTKPKTKKIEVKAIEEEKTDTKIRKTALQIIEEQKEQEKEFLEKEKLWETPAFLRKNQ